jgi:hypothetical protein
MAKRKATTEAVAQSQQRVLDEGGGWVPKMLLQADEFALWEAARAEHGTARAALVALLKGQEGANVPAILRKLARDLEGR